MQTQLIEAVAASPVVVPVQPTINLRERVWQRIAARSKALCRRFSWEGLAYSFLAAMVVWAMAVSLHQSFAAR